MFQSYSPRCIRCSLFSLSVILSSQLSPTHKTDGLGYHDDGEEHLGVAEDAYDGKFISAVCQCCASHICFLLFFVLFCFDVLSVRGWLCSIHHSLFILTS